MCMNIYMRAYAYIYIYIYIYTYRIHNIYIYNIIYIVYIYIHIVYIYIQCIYVYIYIHICICICICICIYIYIYIHTCIYNFAGGPPSSFLIAFSSFFRRFARYTYIVMYSIAYRILSRLNNCIYNIGNARKEYHTIIYI